MKKLNKGVGLLSIISAGLLVLSIGVAPAVRGDIAFSDYAIPTASANSQFIAAGPDGNMWFSEASANKLAK